MPLFKALVHFPYFESVSNKPSRHTPFLNVIAPVPSGSWQQDAKGRGPRGRTGQHGVSEHPAGSGGHARIL